MPRRVLIPLDRSERAEAALKVLASVCEKGDEVVLLSVAEPEKEMQTGLRPGRVIMGSMATSAGGAAGFARPDLPIYGETADQALQHQLDELETYLTPKARALESEGFMVHTAFEINHDPAAAIVEVARRVQPSFIMMMRTTHPGIAQRVFGTVAQQVIREDVAPVMILPAG